MRFPIIPNTKIWFTFSGTLVILSIIGFFTWGLYYGIDFTGGSALSFSAQEKIEVSDIEQVLTEVQDRLNTTNKESKIDLSAPVLVPNQDNNYTIKIKTIDDVTHGEVIKALTVKYPSLKEQGFTSIGPVIGESLKVKAIWAIVIAIIGMIAYIAFAFRKVPKKVNPIKFGVTAIAALFHDIIIVVGFFVVLGHFFHIEVGGLFVTALLTILGYSVNDTIVIFDRIRENLLYQNRGESLAEIAERSIWESFQRSINTSATLFITLLVLFFFGGESIKWFVFALIIGVFFGTYSSIFVAPPLLVLWKKKGVK